MSKKVSKWMILPAAVLMLGTVALAQDPSSASPSPSATSSQGPSSTAPTGTKPTVAQRKENQQDRSFTPRVERAIGKQAAAIRRVGMRH